jgi:4-hydroxy-4-methyl-2-oxoglutarate aldolase
MGMPIWSAGITMIPQGYHDYSVQSINEPVTCGGVEVQPGDYIVADGDGVIVIPAAEVEQTLAAAEDLEAKEARAREGIKAGGELAKLYPGRAYDKR